MTRAGQLLFILAALGNTARAFRTTKNFKMVLPITDTRLTYAKDYSRKCPIVMEVPESLLVEFAEGSAHVKLDSQGAAFLSSSSGTYNLRMVDNSNAQLFVSTDDAGRGKINCSATGIVQVEKVHCSSLPDEPIAGVFERNARKEGDLLAHVSFGTIWSDSQIVAHLCSRWNYYVEQGRWVRIGDEALFADLESILNLCAILGGANGNEFNSEEVWMQFNEAGEADGRPPVSLTYVQYLMSRLAGKDSEAVKNKGSSDWPLNIALDADAVTVFRGQQLLFARLSAGKNNLSVDKFLDDWKQLLETSVLVDAYMLDDEQLLATLPEVLEGRAVRDDDIIVALNADALPVNMDKRLSELFQVKKRWRKVELENFILPLLPPDAKPEALLLKTCRLDEIDSELFYASKF